MKTTAFLKIVIGSALLMPHPAAAQIWTQTPAPGAPWQFIAMSADGSKLIAAANSTYLSTNGGLNWTLSLPDFGFVASSTNGSNLVVAENGFSGINTSADGGATWQQPTPPDGVAWGAIACSADGSKIIGASISDNIAATGPIWRSTNFGATWTLTTAQSNFWFWSAVSSSADGTKLAAACNFDTNNNTGGPIFYSLNSGATWTQSDAPTNYYWLSVAASADGSKLIAVASQDNAFNATPVYLSTNFGAHWTPVNSVTNNWDWAACSADGTKLIAAGEAEYGYQSYAEIIYYSTNSGSNWTFTTAPPRSLNAGASSADGAKHFAVQYMGGIYTDTAATAWTETTAPATNVWTSICSSADGTILFASAGYFNGANSPEGIYRSTNSGATWLPTSSPNIAFSALSCSTDGRKVLAVSPVWVYSSTDFGANWSSNTLPAENWVSGASSADGSNLIIVAEGFGGGISGPVYTSTDGGSNWSQSIGSPDTGWSWVASSADGTQIVATLDHIVQQPPPYPSGFIYRSTNSGANWTNTSAPEANWASIASSADGTKLVAVAASDPHLGPMPVYTSTNSGGTWTPNNTPSEHWISVTSSTDGSRLAAATSGGVLYYSTNSGGTWTNTATPFQQWQTVSFSGNGSLLTAGSLYGGIYSLVFPTAASPPVLQIALSGNQAVLTWLTNGASGFALQQNTNLLTTNWVAVTNIPVVTNLHYQVTVPPTNHQNFYRLKSS